MMREKSPKASSSDSVGYRRPPKQHQFKPGQSGNPKGRPKGTPTLQEVMVREAAKHVKLKQGDKIIVVPKLEALARRVFNKALEGDLAAARMIFQLAGGPAEPATAESAESFALPDDNAIQRMLRRFDHLNPQSGSK
jgi:hypothetical protein